MNKKLKALLQSIEEKTEAAKTYMSGDNKDLAKAKELMDAADELRQEYELEKRLVDTEKETVIIDEAKPAIEPEKKTAIQKFAAAARAGFPKSMNEGTPTDGGYTVPEDISTAINELREAKASLLNHVRVERVSTKSGARTFKTRANLTGFTAVGEGNDIPAVATPQFSRITYNVSKYAGYLPVTNELLEDSDANITTVITNWLADESRVTANKLILGAIATKEETRIDTIDEVKKALNLTLGQAFKSTSTIYTNDDGLHYLDTMKDEDGNYLLSASPADPMKLVLAAGATSIPVVVIPNSDMPSAADAYVKTTDTDIVSGKTYYTLSGTTYSAVASPAKASLGSYYEKGTKIPFVIGDLNEGIYYFDRAQRTIKVSTEAAIGSLNAFEDDLTIFRAIERECVVVRDEAAFVNGFHFV